MPSTTFYNLRYSKQKELLASAMNLFAQYDYDDLNVRGISKWMGITTGAFYRYFGSKEEFFIFIADYTLEEFWVKKEKMEAEYGRHLEVDEVLEADQLQADYWKHFHQSSMDIRMKYYFRTRGNPLYNRKLEIVRELNKTKSFNKEEMEVTAFAISVMQYIVNSFKYLEHREFDANQMNQIMNDMLLRGLELGKEEK